MQETEVKVPMMHKLNNLLIRSGLKDKIPELSIDVYLIVVIGLATISFFVATSVLNSVIFGGLVAFSLVFLSLFGLVLLADRKKRLIEDDLELFLNLLSNYSNSTDSLYEMLDKTSKKINEPFKSYLQETCYEIQLQGNMEEPLERLKEKINHPQFKKIIDYLQLAATNEANYKEIINLNNKTLKTYLDLERKKAAIKSATRKELLLLIGCSVVIYLIVMSNGLIVNPINSLIGKLAVTYLASVIMVGFLFTLKK